MYIRETKRSTSMKKSPVIIWIEVASSINMGTNKQKHASEMK